MSRTGFVARYAPGVRRSGRTETLRWNPSDAMGGDLTMTAPGFEPRFYAAMGCAGPAFAVYMTRSAIGIGIVRDPS